MRVRCCGLKRGITKTSELFYACTQLPITAVLRDQTIAAAFGLPNEQTNRSYLQTIPLRIREPQEVVLSDGNSRLFICPICPHGGRVGVFVLGPYVTEPELAGSLTYRPRDSLPHLLTLLRNIQEDGNETEELGSFCFHVQRAVRLMEKHYDEDLTLDYVAHYLGLNKSYFSSIFRKQTGQTFTNYLNGIRVEASKKLLLENSQSILEIALEIGFSSQDYYGRIFKNSLE